MGNDSRDMLPFLAVNNVLYSAKCNPIFFVQFGWLSPILKLLPYFNYLSLRKYGASIFAPFNIPVFNPFVIILSVTAFLHHVLGVFFVCSKKEMLGIAAPGIVTVVTNKQAVWNCSIFHFPSNMVRFQCDSKNVYGTVFSGCTSPPPAMAKLQNVFRLWDILGDSVVESIVKCGGYFLNYHKQKPQPPTTVESRYVSRTVVKSWVDCFATYFSWPIQSLQYGLYL